MFVFAANSVQPLLMVMPSVNPLGTAFGIGTFQRLHTPFCYDISDVES